MTTEVPVPPAPLGRTDRFLERLYVRLGDRYYLPFYVYTWVISVIVVDGIALVPTRFYDTDAGTTAKYLLIGSGLLLGVVVLNVRLAKPAMDQVKRWIRTEDPKIAPAVWRGGISASRDYLVGYIFYIPLTLPVTVYYMHLLGSRGVWMVILALIGTTVALGYGTLVVALTIDIYQRPLLRRLAATVHVPPEALPKNLTLRTKVFMAMTIGALTTALCAAGFAVSSGDEAEFVRAVLVAFAVVLSFGLLLTFVLGEGVTTPVRALIDGASRMAAGVHTVPVPSLTTDELLTLTATLNDAMTKITERNTLEDALGIYTDPEVAKRVLEEGALLEGKEVEATVMFLDIVGFTTYSEGVTPAEAIAMLNGFFGHVVPVIQRHKGQVSKYLGDGLMAAFGVVDQDASHASDAVRSACEVVDLVHREYGESVRVGIGINTGRLIVGSVGGGERLEFTLIGDVVNTTQRIERLTRECGDPVLIGEPTFVALNGVRPADSRGAFPLKGKAHPTEIYSVKSEPRLVTS